MYIMFHVHTHTHTCKDGIHGAMIIVIENEHGNQSSKPGQVFLHVT